MSKIGIIIRREFNQRVRKRSFILTTLLTPLFMVGIMVAPILMATMKSGSHKTIIVLDASGVIAPHLENKDRMTFRAESKTYEQIRAEKHDSIYGILVIDTDVMTAPSDVHLYTYESATIDIESSITSQIESIIEERKLEAYNIENLPVIMKQVKTDVSMQTIQIDSSGGEKESSSTLAMVSAYIFGFLIYLFVMMYGVMVMQGVLEEKTSKVLEVMVSSVKPFDLMMGKIIGIASVAITQFAIWVVMIFALGTAAMAFFGGDVVHNAQAMQEMGAGMHAAGPMDAQSLSMLRSAIDPMFLMKIFGSFVIFFIGGYLLYAAMFAAIGSAVSEVSDTQQLQIPVTIPLILAIVVLMNVMRDPDGQLAFWFSMIPLTSPIIMMARIPYGVPFWQLALSVTLLYASFIAMVWLAGKVYRVGIFMYGKKPTWKELFKWMRYKY